MQALGLVWSDVHADAPDFSETYTVMREPTHYDARHLYETWLRRTEEGGFTIGRDVPSRALAPLLRNLVIYEPVNDGADFQVRLAGSAFLRRFGEDIGGKKLSQLFNPGAFEAQRADMLSIMRTAVPCVLEVKISALGAPRLHFEILALPVLAPDRKSVWILSGIFYYDWPARSVRVTEAAGKQVRDIPCFPSTSRIAAGQAYGRRTQTRPSAMPQRPAATAPSSTSSSAVTAA